MYELRFDDDAKQVYQTVSDDLARRLNRCFERLRDNPLQHPNIKSLKGVFAGLYRYQVGDWRVIYEVQRVERVVNILQIVRRDKAYER